MKSISYRRHRLFPNVLTYTILIVSSLTGCGGSAQVSSSSGSPKGATTSTAAVPTVKPSASAMTPVDGTPPKSPTVSPFHIVADVDYALDLQRLGKTAVLVGGGQLLPIRDNTVTFDPKFALSTEIRGDGINGAFQFLLGSFPDALYAAVIRPSGRTGFSELYKWNGSTWRSHHTTNETTYVLDIQPWLNGTVLMVESHGFSGEYRFSTLPKDAPVFVPEPHGKTWKTNWSICEAGFVPDAMRTLPSGHVFMPGTSCSADSHSDIRQTGVKRWSPDNKAGTFDALPEIGEKGFEIVNLVLHDDKDAYIAGSTTRSPYGPPKDHAPYLAHFDGKSWTRDTLPFSDAITSLDVDAHGKVWIVSDKGAIFSRPSGGKWEEVTLPVGGEERKPIDAKSIWSRAPGDEWIVGVYGPRHVVLHSGPPGEKAQLPDLETMDTQVAELAMPTPLTWRCRNTFALLFTLSKVAPPDYDYPATREALKGHTEFTDAQFIEFKRLDKRFMGAFVPDEEMGKRLVELIKKKVPNSTPQLVCHAPKPTRVIKFDLAGGK